jgi:hypothetical protein
MSPKIKKVLNLGLKVAILVASYLFIYYRFRDYEKMPLSWDGLLAVLSSTEVVLSLIGILLMMCANWSLEALKWQLLVSKSERIGFFTALKGVLAGITVSSFTPNRVGEYLGRVFILKQTNPWKGAFMTITGSMSQLLVTVVIGMFAFIRFAYSYFPWQEYFPLGVFWALSCMLILVVAVAVLLYFNIRIFEPVLRRFTLKRWTNLRMHLKVFGEYRARDLMVVLALSLARYMVFSLQYFLLLKMFMMPIEFLDAMMIIACIYLFMAAVPTVALSELGVRGSLAMFFMGLYFADNFILSDAASFSAVAASTAIWVINLVIPALIGSLFVLQLRFFKK